MELSAHKFVSGTRRLVRASLTAAARILASQRHEGDEEEDKSQEHETFVLVENYSQYGVGFGFVLLSHFLEFLEARL